MAKSRYLRLKETGPESIPDRFVPQFFEGADGRCATVREIRHRLERLKDDTAAESYAQELLCQRAVFIAVTLETMEVKAVETGQIEMGVYFQGCNALSGLLAKLGLEVKSKKAFDLTEYCLLPRRHGRLKTSISYPAD